MCQAVCAGALNLEVMMNRVEIIEEVKEMVKFHDRALASAALEVVRYPDDEMMR